MCYTFFHSIWWQVDGSLWSKADPSMLSFLSMLLCKRAGLRYSARRALRDDWLRKIGGSSSLEPKRKGLLEELALASNHRRGTGRNGSHTEGDFFREFGFIFGNKMWIFNVQPVPGTGNKQNNFWSAAFLNGTWYVLGVFVLYITWQPLGNHSPFEFCAVFSAGHLRFVYITCGDLLHVAYCRSYDTMGH